MNTLLGNRLPGGLVGKLAESANSKHRPVLHLIQPVTYPHDPLHVGDHVRCIPQTHRTFYWLA